MMNMLSLSGDTNRVHHAFSLVLLFSFASSNNPTLGNSTTTTSPISTENTLFLQRLLQTTSTTTPSNSSKFSRNFRNLITYVDNNFTTITTTAAIATTTENPRDSSITTTPSALANMPTSKTDHPRRPFARRDLLVNLAVILPAHPKFQFSTSRILPAIDVTISRLMDKGMFPRNMIQVEYADSQCSSQYAPIEAFNFMTRRQRVHAFFGPVCDFALAPVARYAAVWNIPILSAGGLAHDFGKNKNKTTEYQSLTRNGATFNTVALFIKGILEFYQWNKLHILYEVGGFPEIYDSFCYLAASALVHWSKHRPGNPFTFSLLYPEKGDFPRTLKKEVGLETGEDE